MAVHDDSIGESVRLTQGVAPLLVEVAEGMTVAYDGVSYTSGDRVRIDGPVAQNLADAGVVHIE